MAVKVAINGFGRIGRNVLRAIVEAGRKDLRSWPSTISAPSKDNAHLFRYRQRARPLPGRGEGRGDTIDVGLRPDQGDWPSKNPAEAAAWKALGVDIVMECTGIFTDKDKATLHLDAGAKRVLVSAPVEGRGPDRRLRRQPRQADDGAQGRLQRLVHDELPGAGRQGAERPRRHRDRLHDHDPRLHQRPADRSTRLHKDMRRARAAALSMIPTSTGAAEGRRPGAAGTQGQARRHSHPRADAQRFRRRLQVRPEARDDRGRDQPAMEQAAAQQLKGILGRDRRAAGLDRLQPRRRTRRSSISTQTQIVDGRLVRVLVLVRQRVGLLQPHGRHRRRHGQAALIA